MDLYGKMIAGLIGLVISIALWVKAHKSHRNDCKALLTCIPKAFSGFLQSVSHTIRSSFHKLNGRFPALVYTTPDFIENKCHPALSYCKSKRAGTNIYALKSGAFSLFRLKFTKTINLFAIEFNCNAVLDNPSGYLIRNHNSINNSYPVYRVALIAVVFVFSSLIINAKTTTWTPTTGGAWTTAGNWNNGLPVAGDDIIINSAQSAAITAVPTITLNSLTVSGNCTLTGATVNTVTIATTLSVTSGVTLTLGNNVDASRLSMTLTGTGTIAGTVNLYSNATKEIFTNSGNLTITPTGLITDPGSAAGDIVQIDVASFGTYQPTLSVTPANALASITLGTAKNATLTISDPNLCFANPNPPFVVKPLRACNL